MSGQKYSFLLSYVDMLLAMLAAIFSVFILNFLLINVKKDQHKIDPKVQIQIVMDWPDHSANDIDLWVLTPEKDAIGYRQRENSYMYLDRDDLGQINDFVKVNGKNEILYVNEEVISIRQRNPGHYVVNVEFYARHADLMTQETNMNPEPVKVKLLDLDPTFKIIYNTVVILAAPNDEKTAFSFDIDKDGKVVNITTNFVPFVVKPGSTGDTTYGGGFISGDH